jgi:pilus assembly protein FimV
MAIGIGDMTVTSYINQPLQGTIAVLQPDGLVESEVVASLASPDDFDRLGLERHYSLNSLRFAADFSRSSRPVITVTTDDPVLEPYLSFLLELKWPEGRVLREYTVFLDLPPRRSSKSPSDANGRGAQRFGEVAIDQYRVAPNDTLGGIAAALKPAELTIDQMMLAIKAANPDSFMRDNINGIRVGVVLAIPAVFSDVPSARVASREVANEWDRWKAPRSRGLRIVADNELLDLAEPASDPAPTSEEVNEIEPTDVATSEASTPMSQSDLALIEARLLALSDQLSDIQEVVDSKDQEIARLKAELAERPVRGVTPTAAIGAEAVPVTQPASESESSVVSGLFWFIVAIGLIAIGWFNRHRLIPNDRDRDETADISERSAVSGGLDVLLPVPSRPESQSGGDPTTGPERGYGESLLTGYARIKR